MFYIFWRVLPKKRITNTYFSIHIYCTKEISLGGVNIGSLCSYRTEIFSRCFCLYTRVQFILTNNESDTFGGCITWGCFSIQSCNQLTIFQEKNVIMSLWTNQWINNWNVLTQYETLFWEHLTILYTSCIQQENNVDYDVT